MWFNEFKCRKTHLNKNHVCFTRYVNIEVYDTYISHYIINYELKIRRGRGSQRFDITYLTWLIEISLLHNLVLLCNM